MAASGVSLWGYQTQVADGIQTVTERSVGNTSDYYDLSGRKVRNPATRGIYIQRGKKIIK